MRRMRSRRCGRDSQPSSRRSALRLLPGGDSPERFADRLRVAWPHHACELFPAQQEDERRPEFYGERTAEPPPARVRDLDVAHAGVLGERACDERLRRTAVAAPGAAEL